jgi:hypothetical protein
MAIGDRLEQGEFLLDNKKGNCVNNHSQLPFIFIYANFFPAV